MTVSGKPVTVRITGEAFVPGPAGAPFTDRQTLSSNATSQNRLERFVRRMRTVGNMA